MTSRGSLLRIGVSLALLAGLGWWLDLRALVTRVAAMDSRWVLAAIGLSVAQVGLLAWRWRYTAGQLGVRLGFMTAWREYYLSIFLNQVLPGGVLGDASRAWRQARMRPSGPGLVTRGLTLKREADEAVRKPKRLAS